MWRSRCVSCKLHPVRLLTMENTAKMGPKQESDRGAYHPFCWYWSPNLQWLLTPRQAPGRLSWCAPSLRPQRWAQRKKAQHERGQRLSATVMARIHLSHCYWRASGSPCNSQNRLSPEGTLAAVFPDIRKLFCTVYCTCFHSSSSAGWLILIFW